MKNIANIIKQLKAVKEERELSIKQIVQMVAEDAEKHNTGDFLSESTIRRVFHEGSENANFDYNETIKPLVRVLLGMAENDAFEPELARVYYEQRNGLQDVVRFRTDEAARHIKHIEGLKEEHSQHLMQLKQDYAAKIAEIKALYASCNDAQTRTIEAFEQGINFHRDTIRFLMEAQAMERKAQERLHEEISRLNTEILKLKEYHKN